MSSFKQNKNYDPHSDIISEHKEFNFAEDLKYGKIGEEAIVEVLNQLVSGSYEVKTDRYRNGHMVVETDQNPRNEGWKKSGINVTTAKWWVYIYALDGGIAIVSVERLKRYLRMNRHLFNEGTKRLMAEGSDNPAKGFILKQRHVMDLLTGNKYDDNGGNREF